MDEKGIEAAAIALAEHCTKLWLGGNHAPAWHEVDEDVREEWRRQVRLVLSRCPSPERDGSHLPFGGDGQDYPAAPSPERNPESRDDGGCRDCGAAVNRFHKAGCSVALPGIRVRAFDVRSVPERNPERLVEALQRILDMGCSLGREGDPLGEAQKIASAALAEFDTSKEAGREQD